MSINALAIEGDGQTETTFVLDAEEARQLGQELMTFGDQVLAEIHQSQADTIRQMEEACGESQ